MNLLKRLYFWLTTDVVCSWCHNVKRLAWLRRRDQPVTHAICRPCLKLMVNSLDHDCFNATTKRTK